MLFVELFQCISDSFGAATGAVCHTTGHFRRATAGLSQTASVTYNASALFFADLTELRTAFDAVGIVIDKPFDGALQKADSFAVVEHKTTADQALLSPTGDGFGADVKMAAEVFDRPHTFAGTFGI